MLLQDIENREWKEERLKYLRKRCKISICFNIICVFLYSILYLFLDWWIIFGGAIVTLIMLFFSIKSLNAAQSFAQETMIYKLADESFQDEWGKYVGAIDYALSKQYEEYQKKHSKN